MNPKVLVAEIEPIQQITSQIVLRLKVEERNQYKNDRGDEKGGNVV